jgi:hypothetical protein
MDRRTVLKLIASLPLGALVVPKETKATPLVERAGVNVGIRAVPTQAGVYFDLSPKEAGNVLVRNLRAFREEWEKKAPDNKETEEHWELLEGIARRIPFALQREQAGSTEPYSLTSTAYYPEQDPKLLQQVRFGVMDGPVGMAVHPRTGKEVVLQAQTRKVRTCWNPHMLDDLRAYHGLDPYFEIVSIVSEQVVLEVANECRHQFKMSGEVPSMYAIYLTPLLFPSVFAPKDFTVDRRLMMRYAKVQ